jgi:recombination protein RecA
MKKKKVESSVNSDELASHIYKALNSINKDGVQVAYMLDGSEETPIDFTDFISTGSTMLDLAISNRPNGGIPVGRISVIDGLEGTGKSLVCAHIMANAIKRGGVGVFIDTENAYSKDFFASVGIQPEKMILVSENRLENVFEYITSIVETIRVKEKADKLVVIVVDSIAATITSGENESTFTKSGFNTEKSQVLSKGFRKITSMIGRNKVALVFTNQLRHNMNAFSYSPDKWTSPGGVSAKYHATTYIRLTRIGDLKDRVTNEVIGTRVKALATKSKAGPSKRVVEFDIYFQYGIDDNSSWLEAMVSANILKKNNAWYTYVDENTGEEIKFQSKDFPDFLNSDQGRKQMFYDKICENAIMKYTDNPSNSILVTETDADDKNLLLG